MTRDERRVRAREYLSEAEHTGDLLVLAAQALGPDADPPVDPDTPIWWHGCWRPLAEVFVTALSLPPRHARTA